MAALSLPLAGETLYLAAGNMPAGTPCFIAVSGAALPSSLDLGSGFLLQIALPTFLVAPLTTGEDGHAVVSGELPTGSAGVTLACQAVSIDGTGGNLLATSQGLQLLIP